MRDRASSRVPPPDRVHFSPIAGSFLKTGSEFWYTSTSTCKFDWFVVSKAKQMPLTWEPYASVAFENSEVIILKLS